ncbi:MarR family winged helix-turn-helix transcriptional regulator [Seleniivibrio woodruffii]|uniref:MarR family winged helix-turn-helix transcriptional regulator n=1 Tax=Seleniivibrio woodruffii TaxID=1078050 RepID=UPI0026F2417A|nr:MarR family transcriptional regulator [Seleniivibrio woodruffii]
MFLLKEIPDKKEIKTAAGDDRNIDPSAVTSVFCILKASSDMLVEIEKFFSGKNLSLSRYNAISVLASHPEGLFPYELADHMGISRATASSVIKGLESSGYVGSVKSGDDRRMKKITVTKEGLSVYESAVAQFYTILTLLFGTHDKKDVKLVNTVMKSISERVQNYKNNS